MPIWLVQGGKIMNFKKYSAELIGTFVLVVFGCGSAVGTNTLLFYAGEPIPLAFSTLLIAFAFGLSLMAMVYSIGSISGCHVNPAVSLAMFLLRKLSVIDFIGYVVAQCLGAIAGAGLLVFLFGSKDSLGANGYGALSILSVSLWQAAVVEIILTFVFVFVIINVTSKKEFNFVSGLVIGLTLTLVHIFGIPFTGTSVNPARSLGPALFTGGEALTQVWVFIVAPLVGAIIAVFAYNLLRGSKQPKRVQEKAVMEEVK
jgi:aquaporin Z